MSNLILFIVYCTFAYFILYCAIMYMMLKKNDAKSKMKILDFIWKCKADFFNHKKLIALVLFGTYVLIKLFA